MKVNEKPFFRELETNNLFLKNISLKDRYFIFAEFSNNEINRYLFDEEPLDNIAGADNIIKFYTEAEPRIQHRWVLVRKSDGVQLGTCGFHAWNKSKDFCEIGYELYPDFWKRGYMSEAIRSILSFAQNEMKVKYINANVSVDNINSIKLAEKFGFVFRGETKDYYFRGEKYPHQVLTLDFTKA